MEVLRDAAFHREGRHDYLRRRVTERGEDVGNKDDPRFIRFLKALNKLRLRNTRNEPEHTEFKTFDEYVEEAERRFWASRGDPATEAERLLDEAHRTTPQETDDQ